MMKLFLILTIFLSVTVQAKSSSPDHVIGAKISLMDRDNDGIIDQFDSDIDGDGIENRQDPNPYSKDDKFIDEDGDLIEDSFDFEVNGILKKKMTLQGALVQSELFASYGILMKNGEGVFLEEELVAVKKVIKIFDYGHFQKSFKLKEIVKNGVHPKLLAKYVEDKFRIQIYDPSIAFDREFMLITFAHELFHSLNDEKFIKSFNRLVGWKVKGSKYTFKAKGIKEKFTDLDFSFNPDLVMARLSGDQFPSEYSKLGPEETLAESAAAVIGDVLEISSLVFRFDNIFSFRSSEFYDVLSTYINSKQ